MGIASITAALASLDHAQRIVSALVGARVFSKSAAEITQLGEALLKAQDALLAHQAALFEMQDEKLQLAKELREVKEAAAERARYSLVQLAPNAFAYRMNVAPEQSGAGQPGASEPVHHVCQSCLDKGMKAVLQGRISGSAKVLRCPVCKTDVDTGERIAIRPKATGRVIRYSGG